MSLSRCLAGVFNNSPQALAEPTWYVRLRLWMRPVPGLSSPSQVTFFLEQASAAFEQPPYRQRLLQLHTVGDQLVATYAALSDPQAWQGAALDPERLRRMGASDRVTLPGSELLVQPAPQLGAVAFTARHRPGERCQFTVGGQVKQVELQFDAIAAGAGMVDQFLMGDRGYDPATEKYTWGALKGPFQLQKETDFSHELPL
ncbi:MAG: chromophore lyase CpcT/CpeT [Leptolyngbya sp.]|nr:chromophore lyase CpcT/CpeT [Leptolyngbya sp.]